MPYSHQLDAAIGRGPTRPASKADYDADEQAFLDSLPEGEEWEGPENDDWIAAAYQDDRVWRNNR